MPPRIRPGVSKAQKENIGTRNKQKSVGITKKSPRRALADKTNSASDDNSIEVPTVSSKEKKTVIKSSNAQIKQKTECKVEVRPRRDRRVPSRFVENAVLTSLCSTKYNVVPINATINRAKAGTKTAIPIIKVSSPDKSFTSSFETNSKSDCSLIVSRPKRIARLPSRFNDHSISPSKFIPLQPLNASTPLPQSKVKTPVEKQNKKDKTPKKQTLVPLQTRSAKNTAINKILNIYEISPDTNNNAKSKKVMSPLPKRLGRQRNTIKNSFNENATQPSPAIKKVNPRIINDATLKRVMTKIPDIKVLSSNKTSQIDKNQDIYEFTFDPEEEPQPQKKKRKKPVTKKVPKVNKPKAVVTHKTTYDQNISKALKALKDAVKPKNKPNLPQIQENIKFTNVSTNSNINDPKTSTNGYASIRIEDIAADIEATVDNVDFNYSPVNSPKNPVSPVHESRTQPENPVCITDPLNLQEDLSFFDDIPVANSSMNTSVRHPLASPWRVEFSNLPIKWPVNAYIKPNMTPAVESSFICSEESNKKHVYTNMVPEINEPLPVITNTSNLKQPSIISYIKEITEKKAQMKKKKYGSPSKINPSENSLTIGNTSMGQADKIALDKDLVSDNNISEEVLPNNNDESNEKDNSKDNNNTKENDNSKEKNKLKEKRLTRKRKNDGNSCNNFSKSPENQNKDCTYFGFNESEDRENLSPVKVNDNVRNLRLRARPVLQELNGPARAVLPVAVKSKTILSSEAVNKAYDGLKSAETAPVFPENTQVNISNDDLLLNDDSQSVHLFEDIEVVHHLKPTRKSYGNNKKLTFQQSTSVDSHDNDANNDSAHDDYGDLIFEIPNVKEKKKVKKKNPKKYMSKKEEKEADEWAAGFNSMCEEIEEFPLLVE